MGDWGTTSAYAENTLLGYSVSTSRWNYLRVRGEYIHQAFSQRHSEELPPRTRRIHCANPPSGHQGGTTSAYAENTRPSFDPSQITRNYLRVRGEYTSFLLHMAKISELPPRTRRIPCYLKTSLSSRRTTSAYAENTILMILMCSLLRNYLRVRGEYPK